MYHCKLDITQFPDKLVANHPELEQQRLANRKLSWDVELNPEGQVSFEATKVVKKPYTYEVEQYPQTA